MNPIHSRIFNCGLCTLCLVSMCMLLGAARGGCGEGLNNRPGEPGLDVGGVSGASWKVSYSDQLKVVVKKAGAVVANYSLSVAQGGTFELEGVTIDVAKLCARSDVACPSEVFPKQVTMTQPGSNLHLLYVTFNPEGPLSGVEQTTLLGNVDSDFDFSIALGVSGATNGVCGLLEVSYAAGKISEDGGTPPRGSKLSGDIVTAYSGGCVVSGSSGAAAAGATVELRVPFSAERL